MALVNLTRAYLCFLHGANRLLNAITNQFKAIVVLGRFSS
jgi:hypothetical protein